jgi:hypothetical protein
MRNESERGASDRGLARSCLPCRKGGENAAESNAAKVNVQAWPVRPGGLQP